ncbi:MAG: DUF4157 domain-containing protein [Halobacteriota archaeon]
MQRVVAGIQAKLKVGQPGDVYEQEADRVAEQVMSMLEPRMQRQVEPEEEELIQTKPLAEQITPLVQRQADEEKEKEEEEILQTKKVSGQAHEVTPNLESRINAITGGGQPLPQSVRAFFEPRFGYDFSQVRIHTDTRAAESAQAVNARAFTSGRDVVFGTGQYTPGTKEGQRLLAHELTHVVQQASGNIVQRIRNETPNITRLREHLRDDQEDTAIGLMGRLSASEVQDVLASREFKELAISAFNNDEMYRGIRAMHGDLYPSLEWMFDEGTDWGKVKNIIRRAPSGKANIRKDNWMKDQFVNICNDEQMAEAVDLLGGTVLWKLSWMYAEGVGDWELIKAKITASGVTEAQKKQVRENPDMKKYFAKELNKKEIWEAVGLLGGDLKWMEEKGIFEDCTEAQEKEIFIAHPLSRTMLTNAIALLSASSLTPKVTSALNTHFKSHNNFVVNQVKATLQRIRGKLPYVTYECEQSDTGMCATAGAYTWWIFGDIHLCLSFFGKKPRKQATTIIHEGAHLFVGKLDLGYADKKGYVTHSTFRALLNADPYSELVNAIG